MLALDKYSFILYIIYSFIYIYITFLPFRRLCNNTVHTKLPAYVSFRCPNQVTILSELLTKQIQKHWSDEFFYHFSLFCKKLQKNWFRFYGRLKIVTLHLAPVRKPALVHELLHSRTAGVKGLMLSLQVPRVRVFKSGTKWEMIRMRFHSILLNTSCVSRLFLSLAYLGDNLKERSEVLRSLRHYLRAQSQGHHTIDCLEERGV